MTFAEALSALYAVSGVAACACYAPQLAALARSAQARRAMSLASWAGWLGLGVVGTLYAAMVVGQPEMVVVSGLNVLCQAAVVALVAAQRWRDHQAIAPRSRGPQRPLRPRPSGRMPAPGEGL